MDPLKQLWFQPDADAAKKGLEIESVDGKFSFDQIDLFTCHISWSRRIILEHKFDSFEMGTPQDASSSTATWLPRDERESWRKRKGTFIKKANELAHFTGSDVYIAIRHYNTLITYSSCDEGNWPLTEDEIVMFILEAIINPFTDLGCSHARGLEWSVGHHKICPIF